MTDTFERVLAELKKYRLLLQIDACLPNICASVAGAPVRGSWWAHPRSQEIFRIACALADHPDVLVTKLISGKITYIERELWSAVVIIGRARDPWQIEPLSRAARMLLDETDLAPTRTEKQNAEAATELERSLLVHVEEVHTASGAHARRLETWEHWLRRTRYVVPDISPELAKLTLENIVQRLNDQFKGQGSLPWMAKGLASRTRRSRA